MASLTQFKYFERLPAEIRNMIYSLDLKKDGPILITSRRSRRERAKIRSGHHFAGLLRVNKQIHADSKTIFYSLNTFVIGNSCWKSKVEPNLQALRDFVSVVPKESIALIKKLQADMYTDNYLWWTPNDGLNFQRVAKLAVKYFVGVELIESCPRKMYEAYSNSNTISWGYPAGDFGPTATGMKILMTSPRLQLFTLHNRYRQDWREFWSSLKNWRVTLNADGVVMKEEAIKMREVDDDGNTAKDQA